MTRPPRRPRRVERTDAVRHDDPGAPAAPGTTRSLDAAKASHALLPRWLRRRALTVDCTTDRERCAPDEPVGVEFVVRNRLPVPLRLRTTAPVPWTWAVDGVDRASTVESLPAETGVVDFARRERKTFHTRWYGRIRVADDEWVAADTGDHTLTARLLVDDPRLVASTTVRVE
ncbi:hypothetical protein [Haloplanus halophilus]|uniref:hypothetical protein n=1 Tax=Haloplanus halophilus TaxID=2949993 RepID=UPI00203AE274|nr:hypothetical protein [Haloplanus sp. GDY1]